MVKFDPHQSESMHTHINDDPRPLPISLGTPLYIALLGKGEVVVQERKRRDSV